jgi:sugar phosphate isomerase/epimerase
MLTLLQGIAMPIRNDHISMTTDYATSTGCPEPYLRRIAEGGFTHVHWCHQWNTDFIYDAGEIAAIAGWLKAMKLGLTDLHGSAGVEKGWGSLREYERRAGVDLVKNRIDMTARLGSDVVIMHVPKEAGDPATSDRGWPQFMRTLDELEPHARKQGVRLALENGNFDILERVFKDRNPNYIGLCYDSGHGNMAAGSLDRLEANRDRLCSLHLHDNDGKTDQHKLIFSGTVDWPRLSRIIAGSAYAKWVSMEAVIKNTGITDEEEYLRQARDTGRRFADMITTRAGA